jgi:hypothetical protein
MVENLVANGTTFVGDGRHFSDLGNIEVAYTPRENFAIALKLLKGPDRVL